MLSWGLFSLLRPSIVARLCGFALTAALACHRCSLQRKCEAPNYGLSRRISVERAEIFRHGAWLPDFPSGPRGLPGRPPNPGSSAG